MNPEPPGVLKGTEWQHSAGTFSPAKFSQRIKARPAAATIQESEESRSSKSNPREAVDSDSSESSEGQGKKGSSESSTASTNMSSSPSVSHVSHSSATTTSRMENGDKLPRLAAGVYYKKPTPILGDHALIEPDGNGTKDLSVVPSLDPEKSEMRGPPPNWQPPCPPGGAEHDYENNYEDPEEIRNKNRDVSRDLLLAASGPPPMYNSYEMSLSQQRRSNALTLSGDEWSDEPQRVLHKNSEGTYYIPGGSGSVRTATSTLSPASQVRYTDQCPPTQMGSSGGLTKLRPDLPASSSPLLKYPTTASLTGTHINKSNKRRSSKMPYLEKIPFEDGKARKRPSLCLLCLAVSLLIAIILIAFLVFRGPTYVYSSRSPSTLGGPNRLPYDETALRPLPDRIGIDQRIEADMLPNSMAVTELFISRPSRVVFNVTLGAGAQMVLLGRHSVPPSLYVHDFFRPLRTQQNTAPKPSHLVESRRAKRQVYDIVDPRSAVVEEFLLEGRWHLMIINERNRVEPLTLLVSSPTGSGHSPVDNPLSIRCEQDCHGHGECVAGTCRCVHGYAGDACEDPICPTVCSGNGVFSGGVCVCKPGFKGKECDVHSNWCEVPDCSGHGRCSVEGSCRCDAGWRGDACEQPDCPHPTCSDHGVCVNGTCYCAEGWRGDKCSKPILLPTHVATPSEQGKTRQVSREVEKDDKSKDLSPTSTSSPFVPCSAHGRLEQNRCHCQIGWTGRDCEIATCPSCENGVCLSGVCQCFPGWTGANCDRTSCAIGCEDNGYCNQNGTCTCKTGWNGENCYQAGCPNSCSGSGDCVQSGSGWACSCQPGRTGSDCGVPVEMDCTDGLDNDNDELTDCEDPECCSSPRCRDRGACVFSASPAEVLLRLPSVRNAQFARRLAFLYQNDIQKYADPAKFNDSLVSLVRGRVTWDGGVHGPEKKDTVPLVGVRVSDGNTPLWGFTLSRLDGEFDLVVNGGQTIQLRFQRNPFVKSVRNIYVPPNQIFYVDDVQMYSEKYPLVSLWSPRPQCAVSGRVPPVPSVRAAWQLGTDSSPESGLMVDTRSVVQRIPLPGSSVHLVYDSSRTASAQSWVVIGLLETTVDVDLRLVHLQIDVAGRRFKEVLAPRPNLTHVWSWDKQNVYRQSEHGLVDVHVKIGYEYRGCDRESEIVWVWRSVQTEGASSRGLEGNAWSLDIHHHLDVVNNVLELGGGGRRFLGKAPALLETTVGTGAKRDLQCAKCTGKAREAALLRPTSLAHGLDGSLFIGDHELIRRVAPDGNISTVLQLSTADTSHSYHLTVSPLDGELYVSLSLRKEIWKVLSWEPLDITNNHEVIAGDGTACTSHSSSCGDGGPATEAQLVLPKGIAFDADGNLFVADGRRIRMIDPSGSIHSLGDAASEQPPRCGLGVAAIEALQLEWPTSISVHLLTGRVFVLDSNIVYELDRTQGTSRIVLGSLSTCSNSSDLPIRAAKDISVAIDGSIYVVESDGKQVNQVRRLSPDGQSLEVVAGEPSACSCDVPACGCDDTDNSIVAKRARFNSPSSVLVTGQIEVFVADSGNAKVKRVSQRTATYDTVARQYTVVDPDRNELYAFNRHGLHSWTQSLVSGKILYNFTYNVDTSLGRLSSIHGAGDLLLRLIRTNDTHLVVETPSGERSKMEMSIYDNALEKIQLGVDAPIKLHYSAGGLLLSRTQSGKVTSYFYDERGRAKGVRREGEEFRLERDQVVDGRYSTLVRRNDRHYAVYSHRYAEVAYEDVSSTSLVSMDEGFLLSHGGMTSLLDAQAHPNHGDTVVLKTRTTVPAVENPSRRALTYRFDWRPFVKRGENRRVAEVNGINTYTVTFDRATRRDILRARNTEEELLIVEYTNSGQLKGISQPEREFSEPGTAVRNLTIVYDSLGRRSDLIWGNLSQQATYDRQNRVVENSRKGRGVVKFSYQKQLRQPSTVEYPLDVKYSLKYDSRGRLRDVTTPIGEVHYFAEAPIGKESIVLRRYPFTKKPFRVALDASRRVLEWATPDDLHQLIEKTDEYERVMQSLCDGVSTYFEWNTYNRLISSNFPEFASNISWQGPLVATIRQSRRTEYSWLDSSFSFEYDDMLRPTSVQSVIEGTAVEPIAFSYNDRSGLLSGVFGYQILREATLTRIQGHEMLYETALDAYRRVISTKIALRDVRVSQRIDRDAAGRVAASEWQLPRRENIRETRVVDALGRVALQTRNEMRWTLTYNNDGRPVTMNDVTFEWNAGGVPKRVGRHGYTVDASGWVIKRGDISFEYDCVGRMTAARDGANIYRMIYDHLGRLVWVKRGKTSHSLFYSLPSHPDRVSHFTSTDRGLATLFYADDALPFAMTRDGYTYGIAGDERGSLRYIVSDSGLVKEVSRDPLGSTVVDTDPDFWIPIGLYGGIDIPELHVSIQNGRPLDTLTGRFMTFGPSQATGISFENLPTTVDVFAMHPLDRDEIPTDITTWFRLVGLSPSLLPSTLLGLSPSHTLSTRSLTAFPSRLHMFSSPLSMSASALVGEGSTRMWPDDDVIFSLEDPGFMDLFILVPKGNTTLVDGMPALSADDNNLLKLLFNGAVELPWRQWSSGLERHFIRKLAPPPLTSESRAHFTIVASTKKVELRSGKAKIVVHFGEDEQSIIDSLIEDLRRREGPSIWRAQKRKVERKDDLSYEWTEDEKKELLSKGAVYGYNIDFSNPLNSRFPSVHQWTFSKIPV